MRRILLPLLAAILLLAVACSSDESGTLASEVRVDAFFDGSTCLITASDPGYEPANEEGLDLLAAAPDASLAFVVTNTSGESVTGFVTRFDPSLSASEALALEVALDNVEGTHYPKPDHIVGEPMFNFAAERLSLDDNQLQYHYILQPGLSTTAVYTYEGIWGCDTSPDTLSLIDVPPTESTNS